MQITHTIAETREHLAMLKQDSSAIALVPTMGNLHAGHLRLVAAAQADGYPVVVSIFVNPLQFGPTEDFDAYPRTMDADSAALREAGVDLLFAPTVADMYPDGQSNHVEVKLPHLANRLCGEHRPGHFDGVGTVVLKLFNIINPTHAYFGEKDFQQLLIIKTIVRQLDVPVEVCGVPTERAADGLALSSRNQYLSDAERAVAPQLHETLQAIASMLASGEEAYGKLTADALERLEQAGFEPDYIEILDADTLAPPGSDSSNLRIIAAARLGSARLIDNIGAVRS